MLELQIQLEMDVTAKKIMLGVRPVKYVNATALFQDSQKLMEIVSSVHQQSILNLMVQ
jgi:hypothetical protein